MTIIQVIILGIVQGLTEFLPISSSAHLVLIPFLLNWDLKQPQTFIFDVLVQVGTLFAVVIFFRKDLLEILHAFIKGILSGKPFKEYNSQTAWMIILATIPAGLIGILFKEQVQLVFGSPVLVAIMLIVTALIMSIGEIIYNKGQVKDEMSFWDAIIIGFSQAVAIFPGVSRSGATISAGLIRKLDRKHVARFSFLLSIPIMIAAGLMATVDLLQMELVSEFIGLMFLGFIVSALVGYFAIAWLMRFLTKHSLYYFSIYCVTLSIVVLVVNYIR